MVNFIICEFNPFHNGHAYLLSRCGEGAKICIMSSHVTQRGDFAFFDKWTRTRMALEGGADLVLELSAPFAMGQAELFARGAAQIIRATGLEGRLCFGTEGQVADQLTALLRITEQDLSPIIKQKLSEGIPYASAVAGAYASLAPTAAYILSTPNNILALEYLKAAKGMPFTAISRKGVVHDAEHSAQEYCSASYLRQRPRNYPAFTPPAVHELYRKALQKGQFPDEQKKDLLWLHALRSLSEQQWDSLAPDGIGRRFCKAVQSATTMEQVFSLVKTKCCTLSSLRRIALKGFIGQPPTSKPQYIRVLGANETGRGVLKKMNPSLPILTKPAAVRELSDQAVALMEYESGLTDTYMFLLKSPREKGVEFLTSPIML